MLKRNREKGFTLAELLIALAILGVIATFTIPKILDSTSSSKTTAIAKETASIVSGAYSSYKANSTPQATTTAANLTTYMNFVKVDTATNMAAGAAPNDGTNLEQCAAAKPCLVLHNGAYLQYTAAAKFGGITANNAIHFNVDPDGIGTGVGRVSFFLAYNGRLTTGAVETAEGTWVVDGTDTLAIQATDPAYMASWN